MLKRNRVLQKKHRIEICIKVTCCYFSMLQLLSLGIFFAMLPFQEEV